MGELQGVVRFTFHPGQVEEFKRLSAPCLEIVRAEDMGTLQYDTYQTTTSPGASSSSGSAIPTP